MAEGELHADVWGEKLSGRFVLVRTGTDRSGKEQWLMFHKRDEHAQKGWDPESFPRSVKSGRTNDEVAAEPDAEWRSDLPVGDAERQLRWSGPTAEELEALEAVGARGSWVLDGQTLRLTDLDKVVLPRRGRGRKVTRRDLVRYYSTVAPVVLPYVRDRPLATPGLRAKVPDWVDQGRAGRGQPHVIADRPATLAWLASHDVVELRASTATAEQPDRPSYAIVAIRPGRGGTFDDVLVVGRLFGSALDHLGVTGRPNVDGDSGIEVWLPVQPRLSFTDIQSRVEKICDAVTATVPEVAARVRLDAGATVVLAPYTVRAAAGAPVSMPLEWADLDDPDLRPDGFTIVDAPERLSADPFRVLLTTTQNLPDL